MAVDFERLVPINDLRGESQVETNELHDMFERARACLLSQRWLESLGDAYFGFGAGGVLGVFLVRVKPGGLDEEWLWVIEGDIPPAYLVTDEAPNAAAALERYADLMEDRVETVRVGRGLEDVFPVDAPADAEHADLLASRVRTIRETLIPAAKHRPSCLRPLRP